MNTLYIYKIRTLLTALRKTINVLENYYYRYFHVSSFLAAVMCAVVVSTVIQVTSIQVEKNISKRVAFFFVSPLLIIKP